MLKKLNIKSEFLKSVVVLMTGTVLAQVINVIMLPLLTRYFYSPEAFGEFNLYMRLVGFVSGIAAARFEMSLPLPNYDGHSYLLYRLSLRIALISVSAMTLFGLVYIALDASAVIDFTFLLLSIGSTVFVVFINLGTNWSIRKKTYQAISRQKVVGAISSNAFRILFGLISFGSIGLILGTFIGYAISSYWYLRDYINLRSKVFYNYSRKKDKVLVREYREFPLVNLPHVSLDLGRELLVAMFVAQYFGLEIFGWYSVSYTILKMPIAIMGVSIGQVFYGRASELANEGKSVFPLLRKTMITLIALSVIPFTVVFFFGQPIFEFVLGANYAESGRYSEIMAPWLMLLFLVSPTSNLSLVLRRQKEYFLLGILNSTIQLVGFGVLPLVYGTTAEAWEQILFIITIAMTINFVGVTGASLYFSKLGVKEKGK
ncbi:MAG: oligosaccharide flippase family protein [Crocinitomicaceae bacterium]